MSELLENIPESAVVPILLLDLESLKCEETSATGFSAKGCRVQFIERLELSQHVGLRINGLDKILKGHVVELLPNEAVVSFDFHEQPGNVERRREIRRKVFITAKVRSRGGNDEIACKIVDASQSGCRLSEGDFSGLSNNVFLSVAGLDLPVRGKIMWRAHGFAGVMLMWQFSTQQEYSQKTFRVPDLAEKIGVRKKPLRGRPIGF